CWWRDLISPWHLSLPVGFRGAAGRLHAGLCGPDPYGHEPVGTRGGGGFLESDDRHGYHCLFRPHGEPHAPPVYGVAIRAADEADGAAARAGECSNRLYGAGYRMAGLLRALCADRAPRDIPPVARSTLARRSGAGIEAEP